MAELAQVDGLGQVVEGACFERLDGVLRRAIGRDDDAALGALLGTQLLDQFHPQAVGQPHVGDQHVVAPGLEPGPGLGQVAGHVHPVALAQQGQLVQRAQVGLVVHDQDLRRGARWVQCHGV